MTNKTTNEEKEYWLSPEEDLNRMGLLIGIEQEFAKMSSQEVCEGICHNSSMRRLEQGQMGCEKVVSDALLERMGVSSDRFQFFLGKKEEEYVKSRDEILEAMYEGLWDKAEQELKKYRELTKEAPKLHRQFSILVEVEIAWKKTGMEWEALPQLRNKWLEQLQEAWNITRETYPISGKLPQSLTVSELFIRCLYARILEETGAEEEALAGYWELLHYFDGKTDPKIQMILYPQLTCRILRLHKQKNLMQNQTEQKQLRDTCRKLLVQQGGFCLLPDLLEYERVYLEEEYEGELPPRVQKKVSEMKQLSESILWLYEKYHSPYPKWGYSFFFPADEIYCISSFLSGRRKGFDLKQSDLAGEVCDEKEIKRIEQGKATPHSRIFQGLAATLRFPSGNGTLVSQIGDPTLYRTMWEISERTQFGKYEGVKERLELLKKKKNQSVYARQNLEFLEQTTKYSLNEISPEEHQKEVWKALHWTLPEKEPEELTEWGFTRQEAMILNTLAHSYDKMGKKEEGIRWMRLLKAYYDKQPFAAIHYIDNYVRVLKNLGNMLGNIGEYEEAIKMDDIGIRLALRACQGDVLRVLLYDRGWNMEHLWNTGAYTKEESRLYIEAALAFDRFYGIERSVKHREQHLAEAYKKLI